MKIDIMELIKQRFTITQISALNLSMLIARHCADFHLNNVFFFLLIHLHNQTKLAVKAAELFNSLNFIVASNHTYRLSLRAI